MDTASFLQNRRVFSLDEAVRALDPAGGHRAVLERLKYAASRGRIKTVARGVYATIPLDADPVAFRPDPFLVAAALRPDAVFAYHSALELLGAAHSLWNRCDAYSTRRSQRFTLDGVELHFFAPPRALAQHGMADSGVRGVDRFERALRVTGPERTLIDGFRRPDRVGGLAELMESAAGFPVLELPLLFDLLAAYQQKVLWGAVGWFLDTYRETFFVDEQDLARIEESVPKAPQYLARGQRGGALVRRWNVIVPDELVAGREPDDPER